METLWNSFISLQVLIMFVLGKRLNSESPSGSGLSTGPKSNPRDDSAEGRKTVL